MSATTANQKVQRQIKLPLSKAIEIAYKNIRMRLSRSLLVTSGIVLALAFLMSIQTGEALTGGMRAWAASNPSDPAVRKQVQELTILMESKGISSGAEALAAERTQTKWLVALALIVAFVGILNAMLMSVTERFREIGTMKCLGALDGFIVKLFLIESLFQGIVGTALGIGIGLLLGIAGPWMSYGSFIWKNAPLADVARSALICLVVGIGLTAAGAVYPAWQAARMQPIEAMRVDA